MRTLLSRGPTIKNEDCHFKGSLQRHLIERELFQKVAWSLPGPFYRMMLRIPYRAPNAIIFR